MRGGGSNEMEVEMRGLPLDRIGNSDYYAESSLCYEWPTNNIDMVNI